MKKTILAFILIIIISQHVISQETPVNPNATPEAKALLEYIYSISGKGILTGQHCAPLVGDTRLAIVHRMMGEYPAVFGQDFGFSYPGYWDGINYRQRIVDDAIKRHAEGFIITLMWHAVPPNQDEPVTFRESIQSDLTDAEWTELITEGSHLNQKWKSQVDVIAWFLKQLDYAKVPVLWRPYHEMNGGWFWWGKKGGENGYKKLWSMMYDRLTNFHGLNNLIWVYNTNEFKETVDSHATYYPGNDLVDILATDVYSQGYDTINYTSLVELADGKPIAIGECGELPTLEILEQQPNWTWFMHWGEPSSFYRNFKDTKALFDYDKTLNLSSLPWVEIKNPRIHYPILKE